VWAVQTADGHTQVVVINKDPSNDYQVQLQVPGAEMAGQASLEWLKAPSVSATNGVTLGGRTFGDSTSSGTLDPPQLQPVLSVGGSYPITVPAASAVLLRQ
jgi:alpha-L-arabinofuranosidase